MNLNKFKEETMLSLNAMAECIVLFLAPAAFLGVILSIFKINIPQVVLLEKVLFASLCGFISFRIAQKKGLNHFVGIASFILATITTGSIKVKDGAYIIGMGNLLTALFMGYLIVLLAKYVDKYVKRYSILFTLIITSIPMLPLGLFVNFYFDAFTVFISHQIEALTNLQPFLMGGCIAVVFAVLVCSPLSSVSIANIVGLTGLSAGAASVGVSFVTVALMVMSLSPNGVGKSIAIILGGPKMLLPNIVRRPNILIVALILTFFTGAVSTAFFSFQNTTLGAGFGIAALIGFTEAFKVNDNPSIIIAFLLVVPLILGFISNFVSLNFIKLYKDEHLKMEI